MKEQVAQLGSYQIENELQESQRQYAYKFFMRGIHTIDFIQNHDMDNCHRFMDQFISEIVKPGLNDTINKEDMDNPKYDLKDFGVMQSEYTGYNR